MLFLNQCPATNVPVVACLVFPDIQADEAPIYRSSFRTYPHWHPGTYPNFPLTSSLRSQTAYIFQMLMVVQGFFGNINLPDY